MDSQSSPSSVTSSTDCIDTVTVDPTVKFVVRAFSTPGPSTDNSTSLNDLALKMENAVISEDAEEVEPRKISRKINRTRFVKSHTHTLDLT